MVAPSYFNTAYCVSVTCAPQNKCQVHVHSQAGQGGRKYILWMSHHSRMGTVNALPARGAAQDGPCVPG